MVAAEEEVVVVVEAVEVEEKMRKSWGSWA